MEEVLTRKIGQLVSSLVKNSSGTELNPLQIDFFDFGGQRVFHSLHHLFMSKLASYLLVFNLEDLAPNAPESQLLEALSFIRFWLNSIYLHTALGRAQGGASIVLVGTHKDKVPSPHAHAHISQLLSKTFMANPAWRLVVPFKQGTTSRGRELLWMFPVDNTKEPGNDAVLQHLRVEIERVCRQGQHLKHKVPYTWLKVLTKLQSLVQGASQQQVASREQVLEVCRRSGMPSIPGQSLEDEATDMLLLFCGLGMLSYHDEPALRDLVVSSPNKPFPPHNSPPFPPVLIPCFFFGARNRFWTPPAGSCQPPPR